MYLNNPKALFTISKDEFRFIEQRAVGGSRPPAPYPAPRGLGPDRGTRAAIRITEGPGGRLWRQLSDHPHPARSGDRTPRGCDEGAEAGPDQRAFGPAGRAGRAVVIK